MNNMDKFCLNWNGYDTNIRESFRKLREDQRLFDVTLVTDDGQHIPAHKIILSAGSQFFSDIFLKSNQTNMLIYLKGINSVQLDYFLDFIYNGEASIGQEDLKEFLETGKEFQVKGFEAYVSSEGEHVEENTERNINENEELNESGDNDTGKNIISDALELSTEMTYADGAIDQTNQKENQKITKSDLNLQIKQMIEKSDGVWKCKVCGRTSPNNGYMWHHAECPMLVISATKVFPLNIVCVYISITFIQNYYPVIFVESQE